MNKYGDWRMLNTLINKYKKEVKYLIYTNLL